MITESAFKAPWWARNPHVQTLLSATLYRRRARPMLERETLELPDGDFLHIDWSASTHPGERQPIVLVIHGLEGSSESPYAAAVMLAAQRRGWLGAVMHFRGCSGEPNRLDRSYHAAETEDLSAVLNMLHARYPGAPVATIGYSLGGSVLLKYLGEKGEGALADCAIAVSVSFDLGASARVLAQGFSRVYQRRLINSLRVSLARKFNGQDAPVDLTAARRARNFYEFDGRVTAPLHGFASAEEYYRVASCRQYLKGIRIPTLIVDSRDDPFMCPATIPEESELSDSVTLELSNRGGHVGFVAGRWPWRPQFWGDERVVDFLEERFGSETVPV